MLRFFFVPPWPGMLIVLRTSPEGRAYGEHPAAFKLPTARKGTSGQQHGRKGRGIRHRPPASAAQCPACKFGAAAYAAASGAPSLGGSDPNAAAFSGPVQPPAPWCKCKCSTWRRWPILEVTVDIPTPSALRLQCRANPKTTTRQTSKPSWVGTIRPECAHFDKKSDKLASQD